MQLITQSSSHGDILQNFLFILSYPTCTYSPPLFSPRAPSARSSYFLGQFSRCGTCECTGPPHDHNFYAPYSIVGVQLRPPLPSTCQNSQCYCWLVNIKQLCIIGQVKQPSQLQNQWVEIKFFHQYIQSSTFAANMHEQYYATLINKDKIIGDRYFAVFQLKSIGTDEAIKSLMNAYDHCGTSILLKHELLYALGQLQPTTYNLVKDFLIAKMEDDTENNLSRHEAAEALANYFDPQILQYYQKHLESPCKQLHYTCLIALEKIKRTQLQASYGLDYNRTMEPAAPFTQGELQSLIDTQGLREVYQQESFLGLLLSEKLSLFQKYRIMYHMRDKKSKECIRTLCLLLSKQYYKTQCSLLKHEICFILGQIGIDEFEELVRECIENDQEEDIVRHEALAAVASQSKDLAYLQRFLDNKYPQLIRESAEVAIHSIKYWNQ